jgi:hypothetical protein
MNGDDDKQVESGNNDRDFVWKDASNYREHKELFTGGFGPQGATKDTNDICKILEFLSNNEFIFRRYTETKHYAQQFI